MNDRIAEGGVTAAKGFLASGVHCGVKPSSPLTKKDLALIYSPSRCTAACVYTRNQVKGSPILVTQQHVANGTAHAILCNSGNANTCNADGVEKAETICHLAADRLGIDAADILIASTGVIGQPLPLEPIAQEMGALIGRLSTHGGSDAAEAIMTTDTLRKECAVRFSVNGVSCVLGGMAKGSGMIHPNMATMLVFLTTDCAITAPMLQKALSSDVPDSFNMVSVDGDTSTNDMVSLLANGAAQNPLIDSEGAAYDAFCAALGTVTRLLCRAIAGDGEGA
ncbi:MAG: bifunctional ornithine acetyltransferase/N-acetylglutamate synthase, partial [Oscillospiraceae bacterium]